MVIHVIKKNTSVFFFFSLLNFSLSLKKKKNPFGCFLVDWWPGVYVQLWGSNPSSTALSTDLGNDLKLCKPLFSCLLTKDSGVSASWGYDEA